ncbi:hypothetical protein MP638_005921 [Amoeboaphelidium occidentale]|nr:hypothetical protein MP638_005921 [Amoeboaphelidium occidentale]
MRLWKHEMVKHFSMESLANDYQPSQLIFLQNIFKRWQSRKLMFREVSFNEDEFLVDIQLAFSSGDASNNKQWNYQMLSMVLSYQQNNNLAALHAFYRETILSSSFPTLESFINGYLTVVYNVRIPLLLRYDYLLQKLEPLVQFKLNDFMEANPDQKISRLAGWVSVIGKSEDDLCAKAKIQVQQGLCYNEIVMRAILGDPNSIQVVFDLILSADVVQAVTANLDLSHVQPSSSGSYTATNEKGFDIEDFIPELPVNVLTFDGFPRIQLYDLPERVTNYYMTEAEKAHTEELYNHVETTTAPTLKYAQKIIERWHPEPHFSYIYLASKQEFLKDVKTLIQTKYPSGFKATNDDDWFHALALLMNSSHETVLRHAFGNADLLVARAEQRTLRKIYEEKIAGLFYANEVNEHLFTEATLASISEIAVFLQSRTLLVDLANLLVQTHFEDFCNNNYIIKRMESNCLRDVVALIKESNGLESILLPGVTADQARNHFVGEIFKALIVKNVFSEKVPFHVVLSPSTSSK